MATTIHSVRADDRLWTAASAKAKMNSTTMTAVVNAALRDYAGNSWTPPRDIPATLDDLDSLEQRVEALEAVLRDHEEDEDDSKDRKRKR